eukprot:100053-Chlamydomonas_euryale.AAC.1
MFRLCAQHVRVPVRHESRNDSEERVAGDDEVYDERKGRAALPVGARIGRGGGAEAVGVDEGEVKAKGARLPLWGLRTRAGLEGGVSALLLESVLL